MKGEKQSRVDLLEKKIDASNQSCYNNFSTMKTLT